MALARLAIRQKLFIIVALFILPIGLLTGLFVQQSLKDIAFGQKERDGVAYMRATWPVLHGLIEASMSATIAKAVPGYAQAETRYGEGMDTAAASKTFAGALSKIAWPNAAIKRNDDALAAIAAARTLITKIADGSNLTLDPDLDSYYVMDIATVKLVEAADQIGILLSLARDQKAAKTLSDDEKADVAIHIGQFSAAVDGIAASLTSAYGGNADGRVKAALEKPAAGFAGAAQSFTTAIKQAATTLRDDAARDKIDLAPLTQAHHRLLSNTDQLWNAAAVELDGLLDVRISGFQTKLWTALSASLVATVLAVVFALWLSGSILRSINQLDQRIRDLDAGDLREHIKEADGRDEIAQIARAVAYFRDRTIERLAEADSEERKRELLSSQREALAGVAHHIRTSVGAIIDAMNRLSTIIKESTLAVAGQAGHTKGRLTNAVGALGDAASDVTAVAAAVTELAASISEISSQATQSARDTEAAMTAAQAAQQVADRLTEASERIGTIAGLINAIAGQTNLLALNATIEAARAGEAGKGFAVVASEVKSLASQTAKATEDIDRQVLEIRNAAKDVVEAVGRISGTINNIQAISTSIAESLDQQNSATAEISRSVQRAADGTQAAIAGISDLPKAAGEMQTTSGKLSDLTTNLDEQAHSLSREIDRLLHELTGERQAA